MIANFTLVQTLTDDSVEASYSIKLVFLTSTANVLLSCLLRTFVSFADTLLLIRACFCVLRCWQYRLLACLHTDNNVDILLSSLTFATRYQYPSDQDLISNLSLADQMHSLHPHEHHQMHTRVDYIEVVLREAFCVLAHQKCSFCHIDIVLYSDFCTITVLYD